MKKLTRKQVEKMIKNCGQNWDMENVGTDGEVEAIGWNGRVFVYCEIKDSEEMDNQNIYTPHRVKQIITINGLELDFNVD